MSYSYLIQRDIPLIVWKMDDALDQQVIKCDRYMGTDFNGSSSQPIDHKPSPMIFGSQSSILLESGTITIPSMGMMSNRYKNQPMTLEFWLKPLDGFVSTSERTSIVQLENHITGIYVENSSFVAFVGDSIDNSYKIVVPVDNMNKPFHVVFVYNVNSFSLFINGDGISKDITNDVFSDVYSDYSGDQDFLTFTFSSTAKDYAVDNIAIYTYAIDQTSAIRHMTYGLGYEPIQGFENYFGGHRYSLAMSESDCVFNLQKTTGTSWLQGFDSSNVIVDNDRLRIANLPYPTLGFTTDKNKDVFSWGANGLTIADGGFLQVNPKQIDPTNKGFATEFHGLTSSGIQTLLLLQDPLNREYYIKIFADGLNIKYQINNQTPVTLGAMSTGVSFVAGYYYDHQTDSLDIFASSSTTNLITTQGSLKGFDTKIFTTSHASVLRIGSNDSYSETEEISAVTTKERFTGSIKKIIHLDSIQRTGIYTNVSDRIDKYTAVANSSEKRFLVKAKGTLSFKIDAKRISTVDGIIGANRVEWGYDGPEVDVYVSPIGSGAEATWFSESEIYNRSSITQISGKDSGDTKGIKFEIRILCEDVIDNPTIISYFRFFTFSGTLSGGQVTTPIKIGGNPTLQMTFDSNKLNYNLPEYRSTPFFWCEEKGGLKVSKTAYIEYKTPPTLEDNINPSLTGLSFFFAVNNQGTGSKRVLTISRNGTEAGSISVNGSSLSWTGGTVNLNGSAVSSPQTIKNGTWNHIVFKLTTGSQITSQSVYPKIEFGSATNSMDLYIDEIMTITTAVTSDDIDKISKVYRGVYSEKAVDSVGGVAITTRDIVYADKEISNSLEIYQPIPHKKADNTFVEQTSLADDVDLASYAPLKNTPTTSDNITYTFTYDNPNSLLVDGTYMQDAERILLKNQVDPLQNGIFVVTVPEDLDADNTVITLNRQTFDVGGLVYVKDGVSNKGKHFMRLSTGFEETYFVKKVDAYTYEGSPLKTDLVARKSIRA